MTDQKDDLLLKASRSRMSDDEWVVVRWLNETWFVTPEADQEVTANHIEAEVAKLGGCSTMIEWNYFDNEAQASSFHAELQARPSAENDLAVMSEIQSTLALWLGHMLVQNAADYARRRDRLIARAEHPDEVHKECAKLRNELDQLRKIGDLQERVEEVIKIGQRRGVEFILNAEGGFKSWLTCKSLPSSTK